MSPLEERQVVRRRLVLVSVLNGFVSVLLLDLQALATSLSSWHVVSTHLLITAFVATPLAVLLAVTTIRTLRGCQHAADSDDPAIRIRAIETALALPRRATAHYLLTWFIGMPIGMMLTGLVTPLATADYVALWTAFAGVVPITGFPIYAAIEFNLRSTLRDLFAGLSQTDAEKIKPDLQLGIPQRVSVAMALMVVTVISFLSAPAIAEIFDDRAVVDPSVGGIFLELPMLIVAGLMVAASIIVSLQGSLRDIRLGIRSAGAGDLSRSVAVTTTDELGTLMMDVRRMLAGQRRLIRTAADVSREVASSSGAVAEGSDQASQGVSEIAHAMQEVVTGAEVQFEQIGVTRQAIEQLAGAIEDAGAAASRAAELSNEARQLADQGSLAAVEARGAMGQMRERIDDSVTAVGRLGDGTANIGRIVDAIAVIADQTNLLALNAAIEAARAGESGHGFAVVAEEVRELASESNEAARRISERIKLIRRTVDQTVTAVREGEERVVEGVAIVDAAGETFTDIGFAFERIDGKIGEVGARTSQVVAANAAVGAAVEEILTVTEAVAALAQQTSANTEEASASSEEITGSADTLRSMAGQLQQQIEAFQL